MPYPVGFPRKQNRKKDNQTPMLQMNQAIAAVFPVDHVNFDNGGDEGKHRQLRFPGHTTRYNALNGYIVLFDTTTPPADFISGSPSLILKKTGGNEIPLTRRRREKNSSFFYLPCGILVKTQAVICANNTGPAEGWSDPGNGVTLTVPFDNNCPPFISAPVALFLSVVSGYNGQTTDPNVYTSYISSTATTFTFHISRRTNSLVNLSDVVTVNVMAFGVV